MNAGRETLRARSVWGWGWGSEVSWSKGTAGYIFQIEFLEKVLEKKYVWLKTRVSKCLFKIYSLTY